MTAAHTNDELQRLDEQFSAELAELANDIYLNGELFARVDAVWQRRESEGLDSESIRLVEVIHQRFVLAGAKLAQADKAKLKVLNTEAATLTSQFNQRLLAANKSGGLVLDDIAQLAGMSEQEIALAAEAAREKGLDNKWLIPLLNTTQQPALAELRDRATREKLFTAGWTRAEKMTLTIPVPLFNGWWRSARSRQNCLVSLIMLHGKSPIRWQKRLKQHSTLCGKLSRPRVSEQTMNLRLFRRLLKSSKADLSPSLGTGHFMPNRYGERNLILMRRSSSHILN